MLFFQKYRLLYAAIAFAFIGLISCTKSKPRLAPYGPVFEQVMLSDSGAFRGFNIGDKLTSIQAKEVAEPTETDVDYLYYEYKIDTIGSFNITYNFDEWGLNEIQSDIFIRNESDVETVFNAFKAYFDEHYGASESHMGYTVWQVKSEKFGNIRINLSDESADFTVEDSPGKLSLWIYPDED